MKMVVASADSSELSSSALSMEEALKEIVMDVSSPKVGAAAYFSIAVTRPEETSSME